MTGPRVVDILGVRGRRTVADETETREIHIAGQRYVLRTDADPAYLERLVAYVEERYQELAAAARNAPPQKVAMLTALRLADELFQEKEKAKKQKEKLSLRLERILAIIESREIKERRR